MCLGLLDNTLLSCAQANSENNINMPPVAEWYCRSAGHLAGWARRRDKLGWKPGMANDIEATHELTADEVCGSGSPILVRCL